MRFILGVIAAALLAAGGVYGYQRYEQSQLIAAITPHVKNASIRVQNATSLETDTGSKATFKEVFERLEGDITEIDKRIIEVQTLTTPKTAPVAQPSVAYLKSSQEFLRAMLQKYRSLLKYNTASSTTDDALADYRASNSYGADYAKRRVDKAIEDLKVAEKEAKSSLPELAAAANKLIESSAALQHTLAQDALVPVAQLQAVSKKNQPVETASASASTPTN